MNPVLEGMVQLLLFIVLYAVMGFLWAIVMETVRRKSLMRCKLSPEECLAVRDDNATHYHSDPDLVWLYGVLWPLNMGWHMVRNTWLAVKWVFKHPARWVRAYFKVVNPVTIVNVLQPAPMLVLEPRAKSCTQEKPADTKTVRQEADEVRRNAVNLGGAGTLTQV